MLQLLLFKITSTFLHAQFRGPQKRIYSLSDNVIISHFAVSGLRGLLRQFFCLRC
jgi:hypothetical protein